MPVSQPEHLLPALRDRRFLLTAWPWRALGFLLGTALVIAPVAGALWVLLLPWVVAFTDVTHGRLPKPEIMFLLVVGSVLFGLGAPLVAVPLAALDRRRLRLIDPRPIRSGHRFVQADPLAWIRVRFTEPATWREVLYGTLLALLAPAAALLAAFLVFLDVIMIISPVAVALDAATWQLGPVEVDQFQQALPLCLLGLAGAPALLYLAGLVGALHGAVLRALLGAPDDSAAELREVARSRARLVDAFDAERRRIERDLHDGAQHRLTSLSLQLSMARLDLPDDSPAAAPLDRAHLQAKELMVVLRDLIHGIRPQPLSDLGLPAALQELAASSAVPVSFDVTGLTGRLADQVETTAYFVASEALTNTARHAGATRAGLRLSKERDRLVLEISDDGRGGADPGRGTGITGLADRVAAAGGRLLLSSPDGGPTLVRVELPC
ncbi:sensor histidine kinase [Micromonosporaceae bacterium Da 78-11]